MWFVIIMQTTLNYYFCCLLAFYIGLFLFVIIAICGALTLCSLCMPVFKVSFGRTFFYCLYVIYDPSFLTGLGVFLLNHWIFTTWAFSFLLMWKISVWACLYLHVYIIASSLLLLKAAIWVKESCFWFQMLVLVHLTDMA